MSTTLGTAEKGIAQQLRLPAGTVRQCEEMSDQSLRLRCLEGSATRPDAAARSSSISIGTWRLVHTPNPTGGADAVSIMQTADIGKSDLDLAGLMFRCGDSSVEAIVVLARPFPPRAHPKVKMTTGDKQDVFATSVVPPGTALKLPLEATYLAAGPWQSTSELGVEVEDEQTIRGVISLRGLGPAYRMLLTNCGQR